MKANKTISALLAGSCLATLAAGAAHAQSPAAPGALEEVIVTAERRAASLQKVPITVSAFGEEQLKASGVGGSLDLGQVVPGIVFSKNIGSATPFIRGVGPGPTGQPGYENPTAIYVDGVYKPNINQAVATLRGVERIEVLKGPQGTLFGRNSAAGVINVITKKPKHEPAADISIGYGNYQTVEGEFYGTTGVSDTLAVNLSLYGMNQAEGWGYNPTTRKEIFTQSDFVARGKLLWNPTDATEVMLSLSYDSNMGYQGPSQGVFPGALGADGVTRYIDRYIMAGQASGVGRMQTKGAALHLEHDFGVLRIRNILAFGRLHSWVSAEADSTPQVINEADPFITDNDTYTEEFHILSPTDSRIQWIGGAFLMKDEIHLLETLKSRAGANDQDMTMHTSSWSLFAQATAPVAPRTKLTLGVRYTSDTKDYLFANYNTFAPGRPLIPIAANGCGPLVNKGGTCFGKKTWADPSYRVAVDHELTDAILIYASWNRGFQSGAFNVTTANQPPVDPAIVDAYELGFKSEFFGRRARLNISAFYDDYKNLQLRANFNGQVRVFNAASSKIKGVDAEFDLRASENLTLHAGVEYLDASYDTFRNFINIQPNPAGGNRTLGLIDLSGARLVRAPEWTGNVSATYRVDTGRGEFAFKGNYAYNSGFDWEPGGSLKQGAYGVVNASVTWTSPDQDYDVVLAGRNLTDEAYNLKGGRAGTGDSYVPAAPRTYMVSVARHF